LFGLEIENFGIFYGHLKYVTVIWYILWPFGNLVVIWYISPGFDILYHEKSGNPGLGLFLLISRFFPQPFFVTAVEQKI
jgi:hypothetical protein